MKYNYHIILIIFYSLIHLSCSTNEVDDDIIDSTSLESVDNDIIEIIPLEILDALTLLDVSYGDHEQQVYDIYLPEGRTSNSTKTIILIHGGSWVGGDKASMNNYRIRLQTTYPEYAIVNMNYVLAQPPIIPAFPNQFLDVQLAIQTLKENNQSLSISEDFGLIGSSAGAHIAMMYDYQYDINDDVKFVANIVGPSDFTDPYYADLDVETTIYDYVDQIAYPEGTNFVEATSPVFAVSNSSSPTLLFYGNQDTTVPLSNAQRLEVKLNDFDVPYDFTVYEGGHGGWDETSYIDVNIQIGLYLNQYLPIDDI